jgi:hypothetical protein
VKGLEVKKSISSLSRVGFGALSIDTND